LPEGLRALQTRFYDLVTAAQGVGPTLAERGEGLGDLVRGDERLDAVTRLDIYANMYFFRILDVLRDAYPRVLEVVGDAAFHNLATAYLLECRPAHPSIAEVGARLPAFLAGHPLAGEHPGLVHLAAVERAHAEVFDGPDAETLTLAEVQGLPPERLTALSLRLIPCHRLAGGEETTLVWRQDVEVYERSVDSEEAALLSLAGAGTSLALLCDSVSAPSHEEAAQKIFQHLARWLADGLVRAPGPPPSASAPA
jgi:hypothetical protein